MKSCPFCFQSDLDDRATKCPHCAAWLDGRDGGTIDVEGLRRDLRAELREDRKDYQDYLKSIFDRVQYAASIVLVLVIGASAWFGFRTDKSITDIKSDIENRITSEFSSKKTQDFMEKRIGAAIEAKGPEIEKKAESVANEALKAVSTQAEAMSRELGKLSNDAKAALEQDSQRARAKLDQAKGMIDSIEQMLQSTKARLAQVEKTAKSTGDAIVNAVQARVDKVALPVKPLALGPKADIGAIPDLIKRRPDALEFRLRFPGYYGPAIWMYLDNLARVPGFRYVVITSNRTLFGVFDAAPLTSALNPPNAGELSARFPLSRRTMPQPREVPRWSEFAEKLKQGDNSAKRWIAALPGFVAGTDAVLPQSDKRQVLQKMEKLRRDWLPVVAAPGGRLVGVVDRSSLTASLLLEFASGVEARR